jgi:hypothetical protein
MFPPNTKTPFGWLWCWRKKIVFLKRTFLSFLFAAGCCRLAAFLSVSSRPPFSALSSVISHQPSHVRDYKRQLTRPSSIIATHQPEVSRAAAVDTARSSLQAADLLVDQSQTNQSCLRQVSSPTIDSSSAVILHPKQVNDKLVSPRKARGLIPSLIVCCG